MTVPDKIKTFLSETKDLSIGYTEINFSKPADLENDQVGYRVDTNGQSLITVNEGDWQAEWIVIGSDQVGDPIIVDLHSPGLTVMSAIHGEGEWAPFPIAESLDKFRSIIQVFSDLSEKRTDPVQMKKNPVSKKQQQEVLRKIEQENPDIELSFWEQLFATD
jgi:hypothetical protein